MRVAPESGWFPVRLGDEGAALVVLQWRVDVCIIPYEPRVKTALSELLLLTTLHYNGSIGDSSSTRRIGSSFLSSTETVVTVVSYHHPMELKKCIENTQKLR